MMKKRKRKKEEKEEKKDEEKKDEKAEMQKRSLLMHKIVTECSVPAKRLAEHRTGKGGKRIYVNVDGIMADGTGMIDLHEDQLSVRIFSLTWKTDDYDGFNKFPCEERLYGRFFAGFLLCRHYEEAVLLCPQRKCKS